MDSNMDMDIDLDIDLAVDHEFPAAEHGDIAAQTDSIGAAPELSADPAPEKVFLRFTQYSLLHQDDIEAYVNEHYANQFVRVQWINDDSLNIVYETAEAASEALHSFTDFSHPANLGVSPSPAQQRAGKPLSSKPEVEIAIRQATVDDVKVKNAAAQSAYYLHNPQHDPNQRKRKTQNAASRRQQRSRSRSRSRDRRGRSASPSNMFARLNYDEEDGDAGSDDEREGQQPRRARRQQQRRPSPPRPGRGGRGGYGRRQQQHEDLFGDGASKGRLRNRSTSPRRSEDGTQGFPDDDARAGGAVGSLYRSRSPTSSSSRPTAASARSSRPVVASARNINLGKELFPTLPGSGAGAPAVRNSGKELFPSAAAATTLSPGASMSTIPPVRVATLSSPTAKELFPEKRHRRTDAFDAADGSAGFNVKGMAGNRGKELFEEKVRGRGETRMRASDLF